MPYLLGADEAGYGPNLGPLVIAATLWHVPEGVSCDNLYDRLGECVTARCRRHDERLVIADSKVVYQPGVGLGALERGVLAALAAAGDCPTNWHALWQALDPTAADELAVDPWHVGVAFDLPVADTAESIARAGARLSAGLREADVRLVAVCARAVFPRQFNRLLGQLGNKAEALSQVTIELVGQLIERHADGPLVAVCDKHGGRNAYGRHLQTRFPDRLVEVHRESAAESVYRWGPAQQRVEIRFCAGGEAFLPTALASMTAKYLRELSMRAFNDYWRRLMPELTPTAGYPVDAKRFKRQIDAVQTSLGIDDAVLWRSR